MPMKKHTEETISTISLEESISLWADSEDTIDVDQLDTPYGRQTWERYHLIGDVLRDESLAIEASDLFYARVAKAIDEERSIDATPQTSRGVKWRRWAIPASGVAAALVATLWFTQPTPLQEASPVLASADEVWVDYIDAHRSLTGASPASYVSYSVNEGD